MDFGTLDAGARQRLQELLGYLNFSAGAADPRFLGSLNELFGQIEAGALDAARPGANAALPAWRRLAELLREGLEHLHQSAEAFRQVDQARSALTLVFDQVLPAYRKFHADLLFHQTEESLLRPLFIGRVFEAVLRQGGPWGDVDRIVAGALKTLNDFLGYRPVAVLHSRQKLQPYDHERVRPVPLFIRGAGVAVGPYHDLVQATLKILEETDPDLLAQACFSLERLDELAMDPRAYDFDHPVNRRPNHHFGQWDPHHIDGSGWYRRFVAPQVTLDAILTHVGQRGRTPADEALFEAAAVFAGTILMASGVSGTGPTCHDSNTTLSTLLPRIAEYRDRFYERLLDRLEGPHAKRLKSEAATLHQPFGRARQNLNQQLARLRAAQMQHTHLAQIFAWMGYTEAAMQQAQVVPVASARMNCQMFCRMTLAHLALERGSVAEAAAALPEVEDLLHRAIECGAVIDPWNILGFGGQFSLFPAVENSIHDHRADELIDMVGRLFGLYTRVQQEAAASGANELSQRLADDMERLAAWWDQFATTEVSEVEGFSGRQAWESAIHVASALRARREAGAASGDVAFWRGRVDQFRSPKAYALVVESLLEKNDLVASMALLIQWLSQNNEIPLDEQDYSFHWLARRWMDTLLTGSSQPPAAGAPEETPVGISPAELAQRWSLARKLFDYLEANAEAYWRAPRFELSRGLPAAGEAAPEEPPEEEGDESQADALFAAAYEDVVFRDSADDGFEGETAEGGGPSTDFELALEAERIIDRLTFITTVAQLWREAALVLGPAAATADQQAALSTWLAQAETNQRDLRELLAVIHRYRIPKPRGTQDSMIDYERHRSVKENLLEEIIATMVETADAARSLRTSLEQEAAAAVEAEPEWESLARGVLRCVFRADAAGVRPLWPKLLAALTDQALLYVSLGRGGNPLKIVESRNVQRVLRRLLAYLPRLGMLRETLQLLRTIQRMEQEHAVGPGAITEFDQMFEIACKGVIRSLVTSAKGWTPRRRKARTGENSDDFNLINHLERMVEALIQCWHDHSRRVRLSVLEVVSDAPRFKALRSFVERYGSDLFDQRFMGLGNLRAILHQGVDTFLRSVEESADDEELPSLLDDLDRGIPRAEAVYWLDMILEAVVENYSEYCDYNSTTTQSDRGEMLYTLLDFLRLKASYHRIAWNLRPVISAHEVLVRGGREGAAEIWRNAVMHRTAEVADRHQKWYEQLVRKYGMRLPTVAETLGERFVRPMLVDQIRALIEPAIKELRDGGPRPSFDTLLEGLTPLLEEPGGVGFELPGWLETLEQEIENLHAGPTEDEEPMDPLLPVPERQLSEKEMEREIRAMLQAS